ncbi:hypothetical protein [Glutamicibacter ardleyensis]|uniref:hypothetical protein n=1 Tax=Glutamicibacter ardleyensis TaxID=225894 RepID=UPI003FD355DB
MSDVVSGFVPRILVDPDIGLFRAHERVFTAMLDGWQAQMLARGLTTQAIKQRNHHRTPRCGLSPSLRPIHRSTTNLTNLTNLTNNIPKRPGKPSIPASRITAHAS